MGGGWDRIRPSGHCTSESRRHAALQPTNIEAVSFLNIHFAHAVRDARDDAEAAALGEGDADAPSDQRLVVTVVADEVVIIITAARPSKRRARHD